MAAPYGIDLRKKALTLIKKGMSKRKAAALLDIGESTLFSWIKRVKEGKELKASRPKQVIKKIDPEIIGVYIEKKPEATLEEIKKDLGFSLSSIWYRLKQMGITLKKSRFSTKKQKKKKEKTTKEE